MSQDTISDDEARLGEMIAKIRAFIGKKRQTAAQRDQHKRRKKEISRLHNRLVQEDRDDSPEARKAYRVMRIESLQIAYCDEVLDLCALGERTVTVNSEYAAQAEAESRLTGELARVRAHMERLKAERAGLFAAFGAEAARLAKERARIDALRREAGDGVVPARPPEQEPPAPPVTPAPPKPAVAGTPVVAAGPEEMAASQPPEQTPEIAPLAQPAPAPEPAPKPKAAPKGQDDIDALLAASFEAPPQPKAKPQGQVDIDALFDASAGAAPAPGDSPKAAPKGQDDIDALLAASFEPAPEPKGKPKGQDDIDALLDMSMGKKESPGPGQGPLDTFNIDEELALLGKK